MVAVLKMDLKQFTILMTTVELLKHLTISKDSFDRVMNFVTMKKDF